MKSRLFTVALAAGFLIVACGPKTAPSAPAAAPAPKAEAPKAEAPKVEAPKPAGAPTTPPAGAPPAGGPRAAGRSATRGRRADRRGSRGASAPAARRDSGGPCAD